MGAAFNQSLEALCEKLETFANSKTVVGEPVNFGNVIIVPLVDVTIGVGAGGSEKDNGKGGGGLGAKITPSAVLVVVNDTVQLVNIKNQDSMNKLIDLVPGLMAKLGSVFGGGKQEKEPETEVNE